MLEKSQWDQFIEYFKSQQIGRVYSSKELNAELSFLYPGTRWGYLSGLVKGKFITKISRGHWQLTESIPDGLTMKSLGAFLRGDNLSYIEFITKKREKDAVMIPYNEERKQLISNLLNESLKMLEVVKNSDYRIFNPLSTSYLRYQINEWKRELKTTRSPTKAWLERKLSSLNTQRESE